MKNKFNNFKIDLCEKIKIAEERQIHIGEEKDFFYKRPGDLRSEFARDYCRIIHCFGFRRLKHKTQAFFHPVNDHVCTRSEHALHVASISTTICKELQLDTELVNAIAIGHDLGHAPFGHHGEWVLDDLWRVNIEGLNEKDPKKIPREKCKFFWHEKNSLFMADNIETVKDDKGYQRNLNLTYAVRDGIICHCGEHKVKDLKPREKDKNIDLKNIKEPGTTYPYTWEGCIVRASDIISYLGRDIEDAEMGDIVTEKKLIKLKEKINQNTNYSLKDISNSVVIHQLIIDLCKNSSVERGLSFSEDGLELLNQVNNFDYRSIYEDKKIGRYKEYITLMLNVIFEELRQYYDGDIVNCLKKLKNQTEPVYLEFVRWLERYHEPFDGNYTEYISGDKARLEVKPTYNIKSEKDYMKTIIHYISGFTDNFTISCYNDVKSII